MASPNHLIAGAETRSTVDGDTVRLAAVSGKAPSGDGVLIINADDWGRDAITTDRILECVQRRALSSASAMVFMPDSERAAVIALEHGVDVGLHLNLTTSFSAPSIPVGLVEHHQRVSRFLTGNRLSQVIYHPGLTRSFEYVVAAQLEEFCRIYGFAPRRVDGHHHMHLCVNVLFAGLLPAGTIARRNFSFLPGEKSGLNRLYRRMIDQKLAKKHRLTDFFFSLPPLEPQERLDRLFGVARHSAVEMETHPANPDEHRFMAGGEIFRRIGELHIAPSFEIPAKNGEASGS
jgi:predicted glycoside hydrolase/deacetylase ChbG (UPF0249 family)